MDVLKFIVIYLVLNIGFTLAFYTLHNGATATVSCRCVPVVRKGLLCTPYFRLWDQAMCSLPLDCLANTWVKCTCERSCDRLCIGCSLTQRSNVALYSTSQLQTPAGAF